MSNPPKQARPMITEIEDYFTTGCGRCPRHATPDCATQLWAKGLHNLRALCRAAGLTETVKWGHPCYMHTGRNIAIIGAFRDNFRLTFFNAALMQDPESVLERQGPNTHHPDMIRFSDPAQVAQRKDIILSYLAEAMSYATAGLKPPKQPRDLDLPEELVEALDADPELAEGFFALTPGRQKSYVLHLTSTQTPATRMARIAKARPKILAGKGATER
jgi:uncharacterized protein YdeI (YjbR/CyaY-like superfamily)